MCPIKLYAFEFSYFDFSRADNSKTKRETSSFFVWNLSDSINFGYAKLKESLWKHFNATNNIA